MSSILFQKVWTPVPAEQVKASITDIGWLLTLAWWEITSAFSYHRNVIRHWGHIRAVIYQCFWTEVAGHVLCTGNDSIACCLTWLCRELLRKNIKKKGPHLGFLTSLLLLSFFLSSLPLLLNPFVVCLVFFPPCGNGKIKDNFMQMPINKPVFLHVFWGFSKPLGTINSKKVTKDQL